MPEIVGGLWITEYEFTRSFGVEPASASGRAVLGLGEVSIGISPGDYLAYSFGGIVFYGIVSNVTAVTDRQKGREYTFQIVDNRVRLPWQWFFAQYNMGEDYDAVHARELLRYPAGEFSSGGLSGDDGVDLGAPSGDYPAIPAVSVDPGSISRGRIFRHRVPSQWAGGFSSYSTNPVSASDILRNAFKSALGNFNFAMDFHHSQDEPVFDVDADNGMTLAALVSMVCDRQGLQCTLDGSRTLRFERRGEGTLVLPGPPVQVSRDGESLSADPTKVRVVGDRTLVQVNNIPLVPDWARGWESLIAEPAWLDKVDEHFGPFETTAAGRAELAARAREATLREYIVAAEADATFVDHGRWGSISRMNMEVWTYLNSIVYRSYRVDVDEELYGVKIRQLEVHDSLLCAVEPDGEDAIRYRESAVEFYPQASAFVLAKGQPLDLISVMDREALVKIRDKDLRVSWSEISDFTFDPMTHSVRFAAPVFLDGDPEDDKSILLFPNKGQGGYTDITAEVEDPEDDYLRIVVPNPDYEIEPAEIKCSMVFRLGPFHRDFGTGARWTVHSAPAIAEHLLDTTGGSFSHAQLANFTGTMHMPTPGVNLSEILYDDGEKAIEKAERAAEGLILKNPLEREGEYIRRGAAGTVLSGVIDRVTIRINLHDGIVETSEFAKPRSSRAFVSGRDIARRVKSEALYEGHEALKREVRMLRASARLSKQGRNDHLRSESHQVITDIVRKPAAGGVLSGTATYHDVNSQWPEGRDAEGWRAGDLLWLDATSIPSREGTNFGGVVVARPPEGSKHVVCSNTGSTVPVAVVPGVGPREVVYANPGDWKAGPDGNFPIGILAHGSAVPGSGDATVALVRVGAGGAGGEKDPLHGDLEIIPESDPIAYGVRFSKGYLTYQNAGASESDQGVTGFIVPKIKNDEGQWVPIDAAPDDDPPGPAPLVPLPAPASWVYLRVKTDADGVIKFSEDEPPVTIEAFDSEQKSIHHVRPSPSGGEEEGDYFDLLLQTVADESDPPKPVVKTRITGNRYLPNQLVEIANIGGKREWYQGYLPGPDDKHQFRSAEQIMPGEEGGDAGYEAVEIIKPLDEGEDAVDPIVDENGTIITPGTPAVPPEEEGDTIPWRFLAPGKESNRREIQVVASAGGGGVVIRGNDYHAELVDAERVGIKVVDGLVTLLQDLDDPDDPTPPSSVAADLNIELLNIQITETDGEIHITNMGWGAAARFLYVRKGKIYTVDDGANVDKYDVISRLEGESALGSANQSGDGFTAKY